MPNKNQNMKWKKNPEIVPCEDRKILHRQIRTFGEWENLVFPGSEFTQCKGKCNCELNPTNEEKTNKMYYAIKNGLMVKPKPITERTNGKIIATPGNQATVFGADPIVEPGRIL